MPRATIFERIGEYRIERLLTRSSSCLELEGEHLVLPRRAIIKVMAAGVVHAGLTHITPATPETLADGRIFVIGSRLPDLLQGVPPAAAGAAAPGLQFASSAFQLSIELSTMA